MHALKRDIGQRAIRTPPIVFAIVEIRGLRGNLPLPVRRGYHKSRSDMCNMECGRGPFAYAGRHID